MLALAQFDFERTSATWRTACEHAISRGLYFGGTPGLGYRKLRSGRLCPNPQTAEIIPELHVPITQRRSRRPNHTTVAHAIPLRPCQRFTSYRDQTNST